MTKLEQIKQAIDSLSIEERAELSRWLQESSRGDASPILRQRLASLDRGEPGIPAEQVLDEVRERLGLREDADA